MDPQPQLNFDQDLGAIVAQLPPPVRDFFVNGNVEVVAKRIFGTYKLHIDQGAILEREIILLLLGLKDPQEFAQALAQEGKIDQKTVASIVQDVNTQIFIPIRDEMRKGPTTEGPNTAKPLSKTNVPVPRYVPPTPSTTATASSGAALPPKMVMPPVSPTSTPSTVPSAAANSNLRAAIQNALPVGERPAQSQVPQPAQQPPMNVIRPAPPVPQPPPQVSRVPAPPPVNLPGAMPPTMASSPISQSPIPAGGHFAPPVKPIQKSVPPIAPAPTGPAKPYSTDPYREPI